jgi:hypothetical protein
MFLMRYFFLAIIFTLVFCRTAMAHEGHGLWGPHFHADEIWGFAGIGLVLVVAIALAYKNRK